MKQKTILVYGGTHGTEQIGPRVIKSMESLTRNSTLHNKVSFEIANQYALAKKKRFIDTDLNRSFPGKKDGGREERLAFKLAPKIKKADIVIDIHSTESGLTSCAIITKLSKKNMELACLSGAKHILYFKATKSNALISCAKAGIGLEFGKDSSKKTLEDTQKAVKSIIDYYEKKSKNVHVSDQDFFEVSEEIPKPSGFKPSKSIKNFKFVPAGTLYASNPKTGEKLFTKESFYPILFGEKNYKTIFGFKGYKKRLK